VIQLIVFVGLGAGLLILIYFFVRSPQPRAEGGAQALVEARHALNSLQSGLLPADLVERVFAQGDLRFVSSAAGVNVQQLFLRERKRIALSWVAQVRRQVLSLKQFHSGQSRFYARLDVGTEVVLALSFASLLILCRVLQATFYVRGPYAAPRVVGIAITAAGKVCAASERSLAFLTRSRAGVLHQNAPGPHAAA
jgi:hypothetical protein